MNKQQREVLEAELLSLYCRLSWYHRVQLSLEISRITHTCPIFPGRPHIRITILYTVFLVISTMFFNTTSAMMSWVVSIGASASFALIVETLMYRMGYHRG